MEGVIVCLLLSIGGVLSVPTYKLLGDNDLEQRNYMSIREDFPVNTTLFTVEASGGNQLKFKPEDGFTIEHFTVSNGIEQNNKIKFNVSLTKALDYETGSSFFPKFLLSDSMENQIHVKFAIYLTDVNDNNPIFDKYPYTWDLSEQPCNDNTGPWNTFNEIKATDKDSSANGRITFSMEPKSEYTETKNLYNSKFGIDPVTGVVSQKQCVDYETNSYYQFTVIAKDNGPNGGLNTTVDFIIRIKDAQDTPPFFTRNSFRIEIPEDIQKGNSITTVLAIDGDRGVSQRVSYTAVSDCGDLFSIDSTTGVISINNDIDRDAGVVFNNSGECIVSVTASEINQTGYTQYNGTETNTTVTITITDVNDNKPAFTNGPVITGNVSENTPSGVPVILSRSLHVEDKDQGANARMDITVKCGTDTDCSTFTVSPTTIQGAGDITIIVKNNSFLDYEEHQKINITIIATESKNKSHQAELSIDVDILDVNDNDPEFNQTSYTLDIYENSPNGTPVGTITATDDDKSTIFNKLTYEIVGGDGFLVDAKTGKIVTECSQCNETFDREKKETYFFTYTATDIGERRDSVSIQVNLLDENDNAPKFSQEKYFANKNENDTDLSVIQLKATDDDDPNTNNSKFHFSIVNCTDTALAKNLSINQQGWIILYQSIDYELLSKPSQLSGVVNITVAVVDDGQQPLSTMAIVQLTIQDVNDNVPTFNQSQYKYQLLENATTEDVNKATEVGEVWAHDNDGNHRNSQINYLIQSGGADRFDIDYTTGMVKVRMNARFDRETQDNYNLTILAIDQGSPPQNSTTNMFVNILDVNDENPSFSQNTYSASIKENAGVFEELIQCNASDPDQDSSLKYSLKITKAQYENGKSVNTSLVEGYFDIHPNNGSVYVAGKLDRETAETLTLTVLVEDENAYHPAPQNDTATLVVTLLDVNDNHPEFQQDHYNASVIENAENGTLIIQTTATDKDVNRTMTYKLSQHSSSFKIDKNTGWISKSGALDREIVPAVLLVVIATDNGVPPRSSNVTVNITVDDFNDNAPIFITKNTTVSIREDTSNGSEVIQIKTTDNDFGPNADITYTLHDNDKSHETNYFAINKTTGDITVNNALDRETIPTFSLLIVAKDNPVDSKVQKTAQKTLVIDLIDVNDNPPVFSKDFYEASKVENAKFGDIITTVTATDKDIDEDSKLRYELVSDVDLFNIDDNGVIKVNSSMVDRVGEYTVTVLAFDHGTPIMNGSTSVNITVLDINQHNPVIHNIPPNNDIRVYECARKGTIIHTFNYTDKDWGRNAEAVFNISELSGNSTTVFHMLSNGSLVVATDKLNAGKTSQYKFQVEAIDNGEPRLKSNKITITVTVVDVNDHLPSFRKTEYKIDVKENTTSEDAVGVVIAYDEDKDSHSCYELSDPKEQTYFTVNSTTGQIFYEESVDYETNHVVKFQVDVKDCSMELNISDYCDKTAENTITMANKDVNRTLTVVVDIEDIDDNPPEFLSKTLSAGMRRNIEPGTVLSLNLRNSSYIRDNDTAANGVLSWQFRNNGNVTMSPNLQDKIKPTSGTEKCEDNIPHIFCITSNGTIINNKYFHEDLAGYFNVSIKVWDKGGSDTASVIIYLISDTQILSMNIRDNKETVSQVKDAILSQLSDILGPYTAVFDSLQDHKENDVVRSDTSDLHFHIVKSDTHEVISGVEAERLLDLASSKMLSFKNTYNIMTVAKQQTSNKQEADSSQRTFFILLAVSISEALIISIVVYVSLSTKNKYQRKLKAANIKPADLELHIVEQETVAVPGSNLYAKQNNPLLNARIEDKPFNALQDNDDSASVVSGDSLNLDENEVDSHQMEYDRIEEKEVTLDMYGDDTAPHNISSEDLLESALNYHQMKKSMESLDRINDDYDTVDGDYTNDSPTAAAQFTNYAFDEDLESTEI